MLTPLETKADRLADIVPGQRVGDTNAPNRQHSSKSKFYLKSLPVTLFIVAFKVNT